MKTHEIVKARREELGMSQDELARKVGYINRSSIARIERGDTDIPQSKLYDIARALKVTPSYLMGEDTEIVNDDGLPRLLAELTAIQEETIENFFNLNATNQQIMHDLTDNLLNMQEGSDKSD